MKKYILFALLCPMLFFGAAHAQIRKIPGEVTDAFKNQYPHASGASWSDKLSNFQVDFTMNNGVYMAKYDSKGVWKSTEQTITAAQLPGAVRDGFSKSIYATKDWEIKEYIIVTMPGNVLKYRILVRKNAIDKKYLYFDSGGKMIDETTTL
jgi:hypothetical protein